MTHNSAPENAAAAVVNVNADALPTRPRSEQIARTEAFVARCAKARIGRYDALRIAGEIYERTGILPRFDHELN